MLPCVLPPSKETYLAAPSWCLRRTEMRLGLASLVAVLALGCEGAARGNANPYYVGASQSFSHDSNLVRLADSQKPEDIRPGLKKSDWIYTTTLFGGIDQPFGRQRFQADAAARESRYSDNAIYNNSGYGLNAGLDWSSREHVSGSLHASANQSLASFNLNQPAGGVASVITKHNLETTHQVSANIRVGLVTPLTLEGEVSRQQLSYSADEFSYLEFNQNSAEIRGLYQFHGQFAVGSGLRLTSGRYPFASKTAIDTYTGRYLDLTALWTPSGLSTITGRASLGRTTHSQATQKSFTGATGSLDWTWFPTGKLRVQTQLSRDTGEDSTFASTAGSAVTGVGENSRVTATISASAQYQATDKIVVDASLSRAQRSLFDSFALSIGSPVSNSGNDSTSVVRFGVSYVPTRSLQLSCNVSHESRSASSTLSYPYSADVSSCSAQFTLGR